MPSSQVYVSTGAIRNTSCDEVVSTLIANGIFQIELTAGMQAEEQMLLRLEQLNSSNINFLIHNYFPPPTQPFVLNLASNDPETLRRSLEHCKGAIALSNRLKATLYTVHSGFCFHAEPQHLGREQAKLCSIPRAEAEAQFVRSMSELAAFAKPLGVQLAIENNVVTQVNGVYGPDRYLCVGVEDTAQILNQLASCDVGLLLDVGHLKVSASTFDFDPVRYVQVLGPRIKALHLNDNNGMTDSNSAITSDSWFWSPIQKFVTQPVPCVLEVYNQQIQAIREQLILISQMLRVSSQVQFKDKSAGA